jgi:hypothetical protein
MPCNHHGAVTKSENRANRQTIAHLEQIIEDQAAEIEELVRKLAAYENGQAASTSSSCPT